MVPTISEVKDWSENNLEMLHFLNIRLGNDIPCHMRVMVSQKQNGGQKLKTNALLSRFLRDLLSD